MAQGLLLDTHVLVWAQLDRRKLTSRARGANEASSQVHVSSITFFEMAQKPRLGKWAEIEPFVGRLASMNEKQGGLIADIDRDIGNNDCSDGASAVAAQMMTVQIKMMSVT